MRMPDLNKALGDFSSLLDEKKELAQKERQLIDRLNRALKEMGYQINSANGMATGRRRGRPRGSRNKDSNLTLHETGRNGIGKIKRRGPGRPRLRKVA